MLRDVVWSDDGMYKVGDVYNPERFFSDALNNSSEFDLQLGYFSSATISVLAAAFASFISKGGKIRLVINQIVSSKDKESITKGLGETPIDCVDLSDFELLRETFDEYQEQFFNCLAFMIRNKTIDIRIIKPKLTNGIAHTKSGQFRDGDSVTSFIGSANFTLGGLFTNLEEIKIDRSDSLDKMTQKRIQNQKKDFDAIMTREKKDIEYLSPDALIAAIRTYSDVKDIDELLDVELKLKEIKFNLPTLDEQTEIVRIIDNLFAKEQQAHSIAQNALAKIDLIKKSILARAFRGQLATNNPADEPAIELLKKVL